MNLYKSVTCVVALVVLNLAAPLALGQYAFYSFDVPGGVLNGKPYTSFSGINNAGLIVGTTHNYGGYVPFTWTSTNGFTLLPFLQSGYSNPVDVVISDVNDAGEIAGYSPYLGGDPTQYGIALIYLSQAASPGYVFIGGESGTLSPSGGSYQNSYQVHGINNNRLICGTQFDQFTTQKGAYFSGYSSYITSYQNTPVASIANIPSGVINGDNTRVNGINNLNNTTGTQYNIPGLQAYSGPAGTTQQGYFAPAGGGLTGFVVPSLRTFGNHINDLNVIVGHASNQYGSYVCFIRDINNNISLFDPFNTGFSRANGNNNYSYIVGDYTDSSGGVHGFLAVPHSNSATLAIKVTNNISLINIKSSKSAIKPTSQDNPFDLTSYFNDVKRRNNPQLQIKNSFNSHLTNNNSR